MLKTVKDSLRYKNALFMRELAYIKESMYDDIIDEACDNEDITFQDINESKSVIDSIPVEEDSNEVNMEVNRILEATEDLYFNDMIGIEV